MPQEKSIEEYAPKFRNLVKEVAGVDLTTVQSASFLDIFWEELRQNMIDAERAFVVKHFGTKR